jgi:hypothetical protein
MRNTGDPPLKELAAKFIENTLTIFPIMSPHRVYDLLEKHGKLINAGPATGHCDLEHEDKLLRVIIALGSAAMDPNNRACLYNRFHQPSAHKCSLSWLPCQVPDLQDLKNIPEDKDCVNLVCMGFLIALVRDSPSRCPPRRRVSWADIVVID